MLLDVGKGKGFYFYNPVSAKFLAQGPQTPTLTDASVVAEDCATFISAGQQDRFRWFLFLDEDVPIASKPVLSYSNRPLRLTPRRILSDDPQFYKVSN